MAKVFVAGATGILGRRLLPQLRASGHVVLGLTRSKKGARIIESLGAEPRYGDLFNLDTLVSAAADSEVVIHAATAIPKRRRAKPSDWAVNDRIRREGTEKLAACAGKIGAKLYIQQSIVWVARPKDGSPFDEESQTNADMVTGSMIDGEAVLRRASRRYGYKAAILRFGWFYCADSFQTRLCGEYLMKRRLPIMGDGSSVFSLLHPDDAANAIVTVCDSPSDGLWHVTDDTPITMAEFITRLAKGIRSPPPRRVGTRQMPQNYPLGFFLTSTRTSSAKFKARFGWRPKFPSYRDGLIGLTSAWRTEGFPRNLRKSN